MFASKLPTKIFFLQVLLIFTANAQKCSGPFRAYDIDKSRDADFTPTNPGGLSQAEDCLTATGPIVAKSCSYSHPKTTQSFTCRYTEAGAIIPQCNGVYSFGQCPSTLGAEKPSALTRQQCVARRETLGDICDVASNVGNVIGTFCPTAGTSVDAVASIFGIGASLLTNKLNKVPQQGNQNLKETLLVTGLGALFGLAVLSGAAPTLAALAATYRTACNFGTGFSAVGSVCSLVHARYNLLQDCSMIAARTLDSSPYTFELSNIIVTRQANACTDMLAILPSAALCADHEGEPLPNCEFSVADYVEAGATQDEAETLALNCNLLFTLADSQQKLCAARQLIADYEPFCTGEDPSNLDGTVYIPSSVDPKTNITGNPQTDVNGVIPVPFTGDANAQLSGLLVPVVMMLGFGIGLVVCS